jgi:hypothetical protein
MLNLKKHELKNKKKKPNPSESLKPRLFPQTRNPLNLKPDSTKKFNFQPI